MQIEMSYYGDSGQIVKFVTDTGKKFLLRQRTFGFNSSGRITNLYEIIDGKDVWVDTIGMMEKPIDHTPNKDYYCGPNEIEFYECIDGAQGCIIERYAE